MSPESRRSVKRDVEGQSIFRVPVIFLVPWIDGRECSFAAVPVLSYLKNGIVFSSVITDIRESGRAVSPEIGTDTVASVGMVMVAASRQLL
jgi:hypothetical protein